jgi:hypothetical protein
MTPSYSPTTPGSTCVSKPLERSGTGEVLAVQDEALPCMRCEAFEHIRIHPGRLKMPGDHAQYPVDVSSIGGAQRWIPQACHNSLAGVSRVCLLINPITRVE